MDIAPVLATSLYSRIASNCNKGRNEYRRILDEGDLEILKRVHQQNRLEYDDRLRPLLQLLAILEYRNGENWCDIHPVLRRLIE